VRIRLLDISPLDSLSCQGFWHSFQECWPLVNTESIPHLSRSKAAAILGDRVPSISLSN